mmetsp:Transcript_16504/g.49182  ORF Transcript_16504/g.49182 Transcript_16504/m.49182 type:complete len:286 (-) Transcript_16504:143-1000(-)
MACAHKRARGHARKAAVIEQVRRDLAHRGLADAHTWLEACRAQRAADVPTRVVGRERLLVSRLEHAHRRAIGPTHHVRSAHAFRRERGRVPGEQPRGGAGHERPCVCRRCHAVVVLYKHRAAGAVASGSVMVFPVVHIVVICGVGVVRVAVVTAAIAIAVIVAVLAVVMVVVGTFTFKDIVEAVVVVAELWGLEEGHVLCQVQLVECSSAVQEDGQQRQQIGTWGARAAPVLLRLLFAWAAARRRRRGELHVSGEGARALLLPPLLRCYFRPLPCHGRLPGPTAR